MDCPTTERLADWAAGAIVGTDADALDAHVERCPDCQRTLERLAEFPLPRPESTPVPPFLERFARNAPTLPPGRFLTESDPPTATDPLVATVREGASSGGSAQDTRRVPAEAAAARLPSFPGYEVQRELGRGGIGIVYLARQLRLNRLVAIKRLQDHLFEPRHFARFRREAEALAKLRHPNIVQVFDLDEQAGHPFFALEYVPDGSLETRYGGQPAPVREATRVVAITARAVHAAHQVGIIHRDLKPANILLDGSDPKVTDFGLAKQLDAPGQHTPSDTLIGTLAYLAPEQAATDGSPPGPAVDVYALGVILYDLLAGRPPLVGANLFQTLRMIAERQPISLQQFRPDVPAELEAACFRCLAKRPADRFPSAAALADELDRLLAEFDAPPGTTKSPTVAAPANASVADAITQSSTTREPTQNAAPRRTARRIAIGAIVVALLAAIVFGALRWSDRFRPPAPTATETAADLLRKFAASPTKAAADPLAVGATWSGTFAWLPAADGQVDGDVRLVVETRSGPDFTGRYATEGGRFEWQVAGRLEGDRLRWEFASAVRDNAEQDVVGNAYVEGTLHDDRLDAVWRKRTAGSATARLQLARTP